MFFIKASVLQLLSLSALILPASVLVDAHGYLKSPRSRNWVAQEDGVSAPGDSSAGKPEQDFCPHCLNTKLATNLCSKGNAATLYDHWKDINGVPMPWDSQGIYDEGGLMEVEAVLTTNHAGHMDMYICPDGDSSTQECLWSNPLTMVKDELYGGPTDPAYPERAYFANDQSQFKYTYKLPEGVCGEKILVQWRYITANSCFPPGYKGTAVGERLQELGWLRASGMSDCQYPYDPTGATGAGKPEQFWNCAEITIKCSNPTVSPAPTPPPQPTPLPQPTSSPTKAPVAPPGVGYCNYNGCNGVPDGGDWCNENQSQCEGSCSGTWCTDVAPSPSAPSAPTPPSPGPGYCNYNGCNGVAEGGDWCNESQSRCETSCSGMWCVNPDPPTSSPTATPTYFTTESPTPIPTTQPTGCTEDPADMFFLRFKNGDPTLPIFKSCQWLADSTNTERLCSTKTDSHSGYGPPGEVCKVTCDTCPASPTISPTITPTANPTASPTAQPTGCTEDPADMFFLRYKNGDPTLPIFKSCQWLADSTNTDRLCSNKTESHGAYGPPGEVCKATCGSCPTSSPTLAPTKAPTKSPTKAPTKAPSASPTQGGDRCCSQFFDVCKDNPWCQESEENCTVCNGVFLYNLPKQCIPRFGMCDGNEDGCCYPSTCTSENGSKQCMYSPP